MVIFYLKSNSFLKKSQQNENKMRTCHDKSMGYACCAVKGMLCMDL